jgi:hypothetical protein
MALINFKLEISCGFVKRRVFRVVSSCECISGMGVRKKSKPLFSAHPKAISFDPGTGNEVAGSAHCMGLGINANLGSSATFAGSIR